MTALTPHDIPLLITSPNTSSERRITPTWTLSVLKAKLEPITGIAPSAQKLTLRLPGQADVAIEAADEDAVMVGQWALGRGAEIRVTSTSPTPLLTTPLSSIEKYTMPPPTYAALPTSVLAYKKAHQIGRFDPTASESQERKISQMWAEIEQRGLHPTTRITLPPTHHRRGRIAYIGPVPSLPGGGPWIGIELDEPVGKNDGAVGGERYFTCGRNRGVFVRAGRVDVEVEGEGEGGEGDGEGKWEEI